MKTFSAVILCKILCFIGNLLGRGSSLPGQITLKFFPSILSSLKMPKTVIAVSGSNGKTSTVEMIAHILLENNVKVIWNKEGSNQIEGVATFLLKNCDVKGNVKADVVLLESDERYARLTFKHFVPTHFVITNLYRDQMTRNAHSEWIYDILEDAIKPETKLILNADDPLVSRFGLNRDDVVYFSIEQNECSTTYHKGIYNDGMYCPVCKEPLDYEYYNMAHIGKYSCPGCGFKTNKPLCFASVGLDIAEPEILFDGEYNVALSFAGMFNTYNLLAAYTLATVLGYDRFTTANALNAYILKSGRIVDFKINGHSGLLLTSKHENSVSYDQSIDYVKRNNNDCLVMIIVDAISRKYYTSETSWLFDINFDELGNTKASKIILTGKYAYDLAVRFSYTDIPNERIIVEPSIDNAVEAFYNEPGNSDMFVITCFSDKNKFLSRLK